MRDIFLSVGSSSLYAIKKLRLFGSFPYPKRRRHQCSAVPLLLASSNAHSNSSHSGVRRQLAPYGLAPDGRSLGWMRKRLIPFIACRYEIAICSNIAQSDRFVNGGTGKKLRNRPFFELSDDLWVIRQLKAGERGETCANYLLTLGGDRDKMFGINEEREGQSYEHLRRTQCFRFYLLLLYERQGNKVMVLCAGNHSGPSS